MNNSFIKKNVQNFFSICIDEDRNDKSKNTIKVYSCFLENAIEVAEISQLIIFIDELFDIVNLPQASTQGRTFKKNKSMDVVRKEIKKYMSTEEVFEQKGSKGTFVVHVQYRQNATWQGSVVWAEKNITKNFRSALELLKLIDGALDEAEDENK